MARDARRDAVAMTERLWDLLSVAPAREQGAVVADLMAIWIAQHHMIAGEQASADAELLDMQMRTVRTMLSHYRALGWPGVTTLNGRKPTIGSSGNS